jgi:hypothetical protein
MNLIKKGESYAKFSNITGGNYTFFISSRNSMGKSPSPTKLFIPAESGRPNDCTKVVVELKTHSLFIIFIMLF